MTPGDHLNTTKFGCEFVWIHTTGLRLEPNILIHLSLSLEWMPAAWWRDWSVFLASIGIGCIIWDVFLIRKMLVGRLHPFWEGLLFSGAMLVLGSVFIYYIFWYVHEALVLDWGKCHFRTLNWIIYGPVFLKATMWVRTRRREQVKWSCLKSWKRHDFGRIPT